MKKILSTLALALGIGLLAPQYSQAAEKSPRMEVYDKKTQSFIQRK